MRILRRKFHHIGVGLDWNSETKYIHLLLDNKFKFANHIGIPEKSHQFNRSLYPMINRKV